MKLFYCFLVSVMYALSVKCQYQVTIIVNLPKRYNSQNVYLASNINQWQPKHSNYIFVNNTERNATIQFNTNEKKLEFKLTNGSWAGVEATKYGEDIGNRSYIIEKDTIIIITVDAFKNEIEDVFFLKKNITTTATAQVNLISDSFFIPQTKSYRRVVVYLPKTYNGTKKFPVLYMLDGQNLFDKNTSGFGEWGTDEYLDSAKKTCIVIGIYHAGNLRIAEYNPYKSIASFEGKAYGKNFAAFIVNTLKPFIDNRYATLSNRNNTFIAGSSMGGLIAYYTTLHYPKVFSKAGVFSPAFWTNIKSLKADIAQQKQLAKTNFYFYAGTEESATMVSDAMEVYKQTQKICKDCSLKLSIKANAKHTEAAWQQEQPSFFNWLLK